MPDPGPTAPLRRPGRAGGTAPAAPSGPVVVDAPPHRPARRRAATADRATAMGLDTVGALLEHLPARYEAYEGARPVAGLGHEEEATVRVRLLSISVRPTRRRRLRIVQARVADESGTLQAMWFNQDYLARALVPGDTLLLRGRVEAGPPRRMVVKAHEVVGREGEAPLTEGLHTQGLVPVYPATEAMPARRLRELVDVARPLARARPEILPAWIRGRLGPGRRRGRPGGPALPPAGGRAPGGPPPPGGRGAAGAAARPGRRAAAGGAGAARGDPGPHRGAHRAAPGRPALHPDRRAARGSPGRSPGTWPGRGPCAACSRARWAPARPWSPRWPSPRPSRPGPRPPCWCPPRPWPSST